MPPLDDKTSGRAYWRSLDDWADSPEFRTFVEREFPSLAPQITSGATRRQFLKIMGASMALAGLTACRWPRERIVPFSNRPENRIPGIPVHYATAMELGGAASGLLVTSFDGRPIKIEGNDLHPASGGKTNAWQQASVLQLYDPDRARFVTRIGEGRSENATWEAFFAFARQHFGELRARGGQDFAILTEAVSSLTLRRLREQLQSELPNVGWYEYEALNRDNAREGARLAFGAPYRTHLNLAEADVIVSFDDDFLMLHPAAVRNARAFGARRRANNGQMNRLYVFEGGFSVTGSMADHRTPVRPSAIPGLAQQLLTLVREGVQTSAPAGQTHPAGGSSDDIAALAADLIAHRGRSVITVGVDQPPEVHAIAHALNAALGNVGHTVSYTEDPDANQPGALLAITELCRRMKAGEIQSILILGGNPAYDAPADLDFATALSRVPVRIRLGLYEDETSRHCTWHVPLAHYLESWSDAEAWDGTVSVVQPLIDPLYGGLTSAELVARVLSEDPPRAYDLVRDTFAQHYAADANAEAAWNTVLHAGLVENSAWSTVSPQLSAALPPSAAAPAAENGAFEVRFAADYSVYDGRFANNGWLQEMPDPVTKLTWDNAAIIAPADAARLGLKRYGDMIRLQFDGEGGQRTLDIPVYILPGHAAGAITLPLGYGRTDAGVVARGSGVNVYPYRTSRFMHVRPATATATGAHYPLATTQDHHAIESEVGAREKERRVKDELVREATLATYRQNPTFAQEKHVPLQLWQPFSYENERKWGMAIDLSTCIGCSACVVACQAENNIPVVGKEEVGRGREMHWIRVDRYFKGRPEAPQVEMVYQPMTCHHCETAPCEGVCPVAATVHDQEGLNVMVYNRCIGTRYCSNNCPFKVRRFNWFWNHHGPEHPRFGAELTPVEMMVMNPDVTVRSRGVMEKCTFCVQRINLTRFRAKNENWPTIPDGAITPACAQACPTDAIVFGDLNDPKSRVRKLHEHPRSYELLELLNLRSRLHYLAKLRNPLGGAGETPTPPGEGHDEEAHHG